MTWRELNLVSAMWVIPPDRAKNGLRHSVPLAPPAIAILKAQPRFDRAKGEADWVFSPGATAPSGFSRARRRLDAAMLELLRAGEPNAALLPAWVVHDIRRSVASGLARLGIDLPVIERCLNHISGSFGGIVGVYQRHSFAEEMRAAEERWGLHIEAILRGELSGDNVLELKRAR
jgi:integrase